VAAAPLAAAELRAWLSARLPDYMVPTHFVRLDHIPLTPNGKVDRAALPDPSGGRGALAEGYAPPATPLETALAAIWGRVLRIDPIGIHDNFFDLGGASLAAIQLAAEVSRAFGVELPLRDLFTHPTIAALAPQVEALVLADLAAMDDAEAARLLASLEGA
jgi:acyl carrier protein